MLNEEPFKTDITPNTSPDLGKFTVSAEQLADANTVLSAMGVKDWKFVQPEDNKDSDPEGEAVATSSTSTNAVSEVNEETGELEHFVVQTQNLPRNLDNEISDEGETKVVNKVKVQSRTVAEHVTQETGKLAKTTNGYVVDAKLLVPVVTKAIEESILLELEEIFGEIFLVSRLVGYQEHKTESLFSPFSIAAF